MDPTLITPLTKITDFLLKSRSGKISIENVIKISQYYGFETFQENDNRLTIAGKIVLIDIDYNDSMVESKSKNVAKVNVSLAVDIIPVPISNFMENFESVLYNNLIIGVGESGDTDLSMFNSNLQKLSILDEFSSLKFDLFNYLNKQVNDAVVGMQQQQQQQQDVVLSTNRNNLVGFYLKIYTLGKYINERLASVGAEAAAETGSNATSEQNDCYLIFNITRSTTKTQIQDLKCAISIELQLNNTNTLIIPSIVLLNYGITDYEYEEEEETSSNGGLLFQNGSSVFKEIRTLIGSEFIALRQINVSELSQLSAKIIPMLQNWIFINKVMASTLQQQEQQGQATMNEQQLQQQAQALAVQQEKDDMIIDEGLNLDEYMSSNASAADDTNTNINTNAANGKTMDITLMENSYLKLKISIPGRESSTIELILKDANCHSETDPKIADKINKLQDLYKVIDHCT